MLQQSSVAVGILVAGGDVDRLLDDREGYLPLACGGLFLFVCGGGGYLWGVVFMCGVSFLCVGVVCV